MQSELYEPFIYHANRNSSYTQSDIDKIESLSSGIFAPIIQLLGASLTIASTLGVAITVNWAATTIALLLGYVLFFMTWFALSIVLSIFNVEFTRRGFKGDPLPFSKYKEIFWLLKNHTKAYLMTFLGVIVYGTIGSLGVFACYIGMFVTIPLGMVMTARITAQWNENATKALAHQSSPWLQK